MKNKLFRKFPGKIAAVFGAKFDHAAKTIR
jgi:hypothetical protein